MKFNVKRDKIIDKIQFINSIVPIRNPMPILTNILLDADENSNIVKLYATDLEVSAIVQVKCDVERGGKIAIPAKNITEIIRSLPNEKIEFSTEDNFCKILCKQSKSDFKLICANPQDFPEIPERKWEESFKINAQLFAKLVSKTLFAVSTQIGRPAFSGVLWELDNESQKMVATDGKRLAKYETKLQLNSEKKSIIMPIKGLNLISRIIDDEEELKILAEENAISFDYNSYKIHSRLIEAKYPDYEAVIPYDNSKTIEVELEVFKQAVHRVSLLASEDTNKIVLNFSKDKIKISSEDIEKGSADEVVSFSCDEKVDIDKFQIGVNYKYLTEVLSHIDTEKVLIKFENSLDPALFYNTEFPKDEKNLFLLMPLRLAVE